MMGVNVGSLSSLSAMAFVFVEDGLLGTACALSPRFLLVGVRQEGCFFFFWILAAGSGPGPANFCA